MENKDLITFLLKARTHTYAGSSGKVTPLLSGSTQLEYKENNFLYRDIYNLGKGKFIGIETIYVDEKPVWSLSYYGNFEKMTEEEVDKILRKALIDKWQEVRLWNKVSYKVGAYTYMNNGNGNEDEFHGGEQITKKGEVLYFFFYAAARIG